MEQEIRLSAQKKSVIQIDRFADAMEVNDGSSLVQASVKITKRLKHDSTELLARCKANPIASDFNDKGTG
jgi:hypothetical protein